MRNRAFFVMLFLLLGFSVFAQESDDWYVDQPITKIDFEGLRNVKKSDLNGVTSYYLNKPFTDDNYNDLLDRLYALDLFEDIEPYAKHESKNNNNVMLVFVVKERPVISSISFSGNKKIRNADLREVVKSKATDVYVEGKILLDERMLRDHYLSKGYSNSRISHKIEDTESGVKVTFVIDEGSNTVIKAINFSGNTIASARALKSKMQLKEVGFMKDGAFQQSLLEADKKVILNYYRERGYVDANIVDVRMDSELNEAKQRLEYTITFVIQEGTQYKYSGISVSGNEVFSNEELLAKMKLREGAVYNEVKFQEGLANMSGLYYEYGYMSADFYPMPIKDIDRHEIGYEIKITENKRSHVENIIIKGNTKTKDYVIRREIPIEPGDVFSRDKIVNGIRNLYNLQYFSNIIPEPQAGSEENLVDLVFNVEEQSTTTLNFGMTFSGVTDPNEIPISLYGRLQNTNLFGEGKSLSTQLTLSNTQQSIDLTYGQNWIGNLPIAFSQSLSFSHTNSTTQTNWYSPTMGLDQYYYYMAYEGWTGSLGTAFSRRWTPDFAILTAGAGITNSLTNYVYDESAFTPTDLGISMFANRWGLLNSVWTSFSVDGRDISYDPSKGWFTSERLSWYGLIPGLEKEFFLKSDTKLEGYLTLFNIPFTDEYSLKGVLAGLTSFTALFPAFDTTISESNRLYIDGMFNGRGWTEIYKTSAARGQAMWSSQVEFRVPIVPNIIGVDVFHDAVAIKDNVGEMFSGLNLNDFYFSFGPGIRFLVPQFPLHLLFTWRYRIQDGQFQWADSNNIKDAFQFVLSFNITNR
ncbi:MAG: outer membrane protein assembly factor BamA [Treponema sp.]|nr:outer membrane protein assembly factor BamA [Treponema sp.]